jgi:hypothetical protein
MARRGTKLGFSVVAIPPDDRKPGPLTSDDRGWSNDPTRGGDIQCSGVMAERQGAIEFKIRTVNTRWDLSGNPYGIGEHESEEE